MNADSEGNDHEDEGQEQAQTQDQEENQSFASSSSFAPTSVESFGIDSPISTNFPPSPPGQLNDNAQWMRTQNLSPNPRTLDLAFTNENEIRIGHVLDVLPSFEHFFLGGSQTD
jgi:hypothetical protein